MAVTVQDEGSTSGALVGTHMLHVLARAQRIRSHRDFFAWLQADVQAFIPHHTLIAAWGDLDADPSQDERDGSGRIDFDISSALAADATKAASREPQLPALMRRLYARLTASPGDWYLLRGRQAIASVCGDVARGHLLRRLRHGTHAVLVHNVPCARAGEDCLYVFLLTDHDYRMDAFALDVLLPQLDVALRRVDCLPSEEAAEEAAAAERLSALSDREREVLCWVCRGKSNEEIGQILSISHNTVKNHLKRIFAKLGVSSRSQAVSAYVGGIELRRGAPIS